MKLKRRSRAAWQGSVDEGAGTIALGSGAFEGEYSLRGRTEEGERTTNPEELIGAALAGCYTMSLANLLTEQERAPERLDTTATVYLEQREEGFMIPRIDLETTGDVPGVDAAEFQRLAEEAERGCPVSKVLAAAEISVQARLGELR
jgi:osmotically inducible protein OsmC